MAKRRQPVAPVLIPHWALREALPTLGCKPGSDEALQCLHDHIASFAKQVVEDAAEERKRAFQKTSNGRPKQTLHKKISEGDVMTVLEKPGRTFSASSVAERTDPLDKRMLPLAKMMPVSAHPGSNPLTMNSFFLRSHNN